LLRVNTLITWAVLNLEEMSIHSSKVFDELDDWIVILVQKANEVSQDAVREIRTAIVNKESYLDSVLIADISLSDHIELLTFEEGPPLYMQGLEHELILEETRFSLQSLNSLYDSFRSHSCGADLLDAETFIMIIVLNI